MHPETFVSIGLPVYNGASTLRRALDSLLAQEHRNFEIVISDDCSSDATLSICQEYAARDSRIILHENACNRGSVDNLRYVADLARGEFFLYASQDDIWEPAFIQTMLRAMAGNPGAIAAMSAVRAIYHDGELSGETRLMAPDWPQNQSMFATAISVVTKRGRADGVVKNNLFIHGLIRSSIFKDVLDSFPGIFVSERQLVCHMALAGRMIYVDDILFTKEVSRQSLAARRPHDPLVKKKQAVRSPHVEYLASMVRSILRAKTVPASRKAWLVPIAAAYLYEMMVKRWCSNVMQFSKDHLPQPVVDALRQLRR